MLTSLIRWTVGTLVAASSVAAQTPASLTQNKVSARKVLEEVLGQGRIQENEILYAPGFVAHGGTLDVGRDEDRRATQMWRTAFPDIRIAVTHVVAEGQLVLVRYQADGTQTGPLPGIPVTGKAVRLTGMTLFRFVKGQITEEWTEFNEASLLRQLGMLPGG